MLPCARRVGCATPQWGQKKIITKMLFYPWKEQPLGAKGPSSCTSCTRDASERTASGLTQTFWGYKKIPFASKRTYKACTPTCRTNHPVTTALSLKSHLQAGQTPRNQHRHPRVPGDGFRTQHVGSPASDKSQECNFPYSQAVPVMQVQCGSWWVSWDPAAPGDLGSSQRASGPCAAQLRPRRGICTGSKPHTSQHAHVSASRTLVKGNFCKGKLSPDSS